MDTSKSETEPKEVETEVFNFEGKDARIRQLSDGKIEVELPEGLSEESANKFKESLKQGSKLIASLNKKHYDFNKQKESANEEIQNLKKELENLKSKVSGGGGDDDAEIPLWKELGLDGEHDIKQFAIEHHDAYMQALTKRMEKSAIEKVQSNVSKTLELQTLTQTIKAAGLDPEDVQNFAKYYGMPMSEKVVDLYRSHHGIKRDPIVDAQMNAQKNQITFIEQGKRKPDIASMQKSDLKRLPDSELNSLIKSFMG